MKNCDAVLMIRAHRMLAHVPGGVNRRRVSRIISVYNFLPAEAQLKMRIELCSYWGGDPERYGRAAVRRGRCEYLGGGGRNKGSAIKPYQLWIVWA